MSTIKMKCACGWTVAANDIDTVLAATAKHDEDCPLTDSEGDE